MLGVLAIFVLAALLHASVIVTWGFVFASVMVFWLLDALTVRLVLAGEKHGLRGYKA